MKADAIRRATLLFALAAASAVGSVWGPTTIDERAFAARMDADSPLGPVVVAPGPLRTGWWWPGCSLEEAERQELGITTDAAANTSSYASDNSDVSGDSGALSPRLPNPGLRLPWSAGETWYLTSGPHENRRAALDFAPPNLNAKTQEPFADTCSRERSHQYWVRAAAAGRVASVLRRGCPLVEIEHEDGTASNYFHLERASVRATGLKVGDVVEAGQILGHPSCEVGPPVCGASQPATGVHVHFYRTVAGTRKRLPANGLVLSGWKVRTVGQMREGILLSGLDRRSTRGHAVGRACPPGTEACAGQRNDLESDNAPPMSETALAVANHGSTAGHQQ